MFIGLNLVCVIICCYFLLVDKYEVFKEVKYFMVWYLMCCYCLWYVIVVCSSFVCVDFIYYYWVNWWEKF